MDSVGSVDRAAVAESTLPIALRQSSNNDDRGYTIYVLTILSLTFASISVVSTLGTLYWFMRMRRNFRHQLILLLIQSDILKSMAYVVFPIVSLIKDDVKSDSAFCQLSGVTLAIGIESADVAVLLIALHSVMYIFRPRSGLYPYRKLAYLVFYLFPVTTACLAFIDGKGYENVGYYCYLRTDRTWARLMLSWIPRYFVCAGIAAIYAFIYLYIWNRLGDYGRRSSEALQQRRLSSVSTSVPAIPRICYHGLIPSTPTSRRTSAVDTISVVKDVQMPGSATSTLPPGSSRANPEIQWDWAGFTQTRAPLANTSLADETGDPLSPNSSFVSSPPPLRTPRPRVTTTTDGLPDPTNQNLTQHQPTPPVSQHVSFVADHCGCDERSASLTNLIPGIQKTLPYRGRSPSAPETQGADEPSPIAHPQIAGDNDTDGAHGGVVSQQRDRLRRQLRSLFVYPLAYMIVWIFPFVSHVMDYDHSVTGHEPRWLLVVGIISLCVQGAVDCALFMVREEPWRHAKGRDQFGWLWDRSSGGRRRTAGRTREEMLVDGRLARLRRDGEILEERAIRGNVGRRKAVTEWWEADPEFLDGSLDEEERGSIHGEVNGVVGRTVD